MQFIKLNLRWKIFIVVSLGLMVAYAGVGAFRLYQVKKGFDEEINRSGQERAALVADAVANMIIGYDYSNMEALAARIAALQDVEKVNIYNIDGKLMVSAKTANFDSEYKGLNYPLGMTIFTAPVTFSGQKIGKVELLVTRERFNELKKTSYKTLVSAILISILFFGFVIYFAVTYFIVNPLLRLSKAADQLAMGDFSAELPPKTRDELGTMVNAFEVMRESRKQTEARLQTVIDHSPDAFIQLDSNGSIIDWNDKAVSIFGFEKSEALGKEFSMVMPPHEMGLNPGYRKCYQKSADVLGVIREVVGQRKDGSRFPLELRTSEIPFEEGNAFIISARDITQLKDSQNRLLNAMTAAEAANAAKSTFLSNMSHEIRTPMNSIIGMANLALKTHLNTKQHDYVSKINFSAQHLLGLLNDILDFSKIEANKLEIEEVNFTLSALFKGLSGQLAHAAASKGLSLKFELDEKLSVPLRGDPMRLSQILLNFISNAIKFTQTGEIKVSAVLLVERAGEFEIRFEVRDSGVGLSNEEIGKLFHAFHQADTSTTRKYGGSGLGLAICKQLVELMDGTIGVDSEPGKGSVFWIAVRLPFGEKINVMKQIVNLDLSSLQDKSILLVEDNIFNQQVASEILQEVGINVSIANNGKEAIECLLQKTFDCVLMDVQMPVMDGFEATRQIRTTPVLANTIIIAMTANAGVEDKARCFAAGMNDFISKPVFADQLYAVIAKHLNVVDMLVVEELPKLATYPLRRSADLQAQTGRSAEREVAALIDLTSLGKMLGFDPHKINKFAQKFLNSAQQGLVEIEAALKEGNWEALAALGHRNKSPARTVGAHSYANLCQSLEQFKEGGDTETASRIVAQMHQLLKKIAVQINIYAAMHT
jgi:two-component system sensor histidine kinase/response regulator